MNKNLFDIPNHGGNEKAAIIYLDVFSFLTYQLIFFNNDNLQMLVRL